MKRRIPLWVSIPWYIVALAIFIHWEVTSRYDTSAFQIQWAPLAFWMMFVDWMKRPTKPYPRFK